MRAASSGADVLFGAGGQRGILRGSEIAVWLGQWPIGPYPKKWVSCRTTSMFDV